MKNGAYLEKVKEPKVSKKLYLDSASVQNPNERDRKKEKEKEKRKSLISHCGIDRPN